MQGGSPTVSATTVPSANSRSSAVRISSAGTYRNFAAFGRYRLLQSMSFRFRFDHGSPVTRTASLGSTPILVEPPRPIMCLPAAVCRATGPTPSDSTEYMWKSPWQSASAQPLGPQCRTVPFSHSCRDRSSTSSTDRSRTFPRTFSIR